MTPFIVIPLKIFQKFHSLFFEIIKKLIRLTVTTVKGISVLFVLCSTAYISWCDLRYTVQRINFVNFLSAPVYESAFVFGERVRCKTMRAFTTNIIHTYGLLCVRSQFFFMKTVIHNCLSFWHSFSNYLGHMNHRKPYSEGKYNTGSTIPEKQRANMKQESISYSF